MKRQINNVPKKKIVPKKKVVVKKNVVSKKSVISKAEKMAAEIPKCKVIVENMTTLQIIRKQVEVMREVKARRIAQRIRNLPFLQIAYAVQIIKENEPNLIASSTGEIDFCLLSDKTLSALKSFLNPNAKPIQSQVQASNGNAPNRHEEPVNSLNRMLSNISIGDNSIEVEISNRDGRRESILFSPEMWMNMRKTMSRHFQAAGYHVDEMDSLLLPFLGDWFAALRPTGNFFFFTNLIIYLQYIKQ